MRHAHFGHRARRAVRLITAPNAKLGGTSVAAGGTQGNVTNLKHVNAKSLNAKDDCCAARDITSSLCLRQRGHFTNIKAVLA